MIVGPVVLVISGILRCTVEVEALDVTVQPEVVEQLDEQSVRVDCIWKDDTQTSSVQFAAQTETVLTGQGIDVGAGRLYVLLGPLGSPGVTTGGTGNGRGTMGGMKIQPKLVLLEMDALPLELGGP